MKKIFLYVLSVIMLISQFSTSVMAVEKNNIIFTPLIENCIEFSGWTGTSNLKRQDGITMAPTGSGVAKFIVPESVEGWTTLYYWIPEYSNGYSETIDCTIGLEITDENGNVRTVYKRITEGNGGNWVSLGSTYFTKGVTEYVNVTGKGTGRNKRLTDVKFVSGGHAAYKLLPENFIITGGWEYEYNTNFGAYNNKVLTFKNTEGKDGAVEIKGMLPGDYYVYVHTSDFNYRTGKRKFGLEIDGIKYFKAYDENKKEPIWFGTHLVGTEHENAIEDSSKATAVFAWEKMAYPSEIISVAEDGQLDLAVFAFTSYHGYACKQS